MEFINVTDVTIPEGNVTKIQETNSGRVLWEKKVINSSIGYFFTIGGKSTPKFYYNGINDISSTEDGHVSVFYSTQDLRNITNLLGANKVITDLGTVNVVARYITSKGASIYLTDAEWGVTDFWMLPSSYEKFGSIVFVNVLKNPIQYMTSNMPNALKVQKSKNPYQFKPPSQGVISTPYPFLERELNQYADIYQSKSNESKYDPNTSNIFVIFFLYYTSKTLEKIIGASSKDKNTTLDSPLYGVPCYSPTIAFVMHTEANNTPIIILEPE